MFGVYQYFKVVATTFQLKLLNKLKINQLHLMEYLLILI